MSRIFKTALGLLQQTASDWMSDNAPRLGAAVAYYTVFAISPLMIIVVGIAGLWFGEAAHQQILDEIRGLIGAEGAEAVRGVLAQTRRPEGGTWTAVLAVGTLLVGATGVFVELQNALDTIWGVKPKASGSWASFLWNRVLSFAMILAIGFLLLVSLIVSAALAALGNYLTGFAPEVDLLWQSLNFALSFGVITLLFALIFKVLPDVQVAWKDVWFGALITAFLFTLGKFVLGQYLGRAGIASAYGAAGSVVVILIWVYYSAQIVFFGAEFTQVYANYDGQRLAPVEFAEPLTVDDTVPAALKRRAESACILPQPPQPRPTASLQKRAWKFAIPIAAVAAWGWYHLRKPPVPDPTNRVAPQPRRQT